MSLGKILALSWGVSLQAGLLAWENDSPAEAISAGIRSEEKADRPVSAVNDVANASAKPAESDEPADEEPAGEDARGAEQDAPGRKPPRGIDLVPGLISPRGNRCLEHAFEDIRAAQIHLRFGIAEFGNIRAFERARRLLNAAQQELDQLPQNSNNELQQQRMSLGDIAAHLDEEAAGLRADARQTLTGYFPLIRAFDLKLGEDEEHIPTSFNTITARRKAVAEALSRIAATSSSDAILALVLVAGDLAESPSGSSLASLADSQARIAFGKLPNVTLMPGSLRSQLTAIPAWDAGDPKFDPLCRQLLKALGATEPKGLMLVLMREFEPETHDGYWVQVQQRTFGAAALKDAEDDADSLEADKARFAEAFTRARAVYRLPIFGGIASLGVLAIATYVLWAMRRISPTPKWSNRLMVPATGFLIGAILAPLVVLAMGQGMPEARSSVSSSFWWPAVTGALSLVLPSGVMRLGLGTAGRYLPSLSCHGLWGLAFVPVGMGVAAGWVAPAGYVFGWEAVLLISAMSVAGALLLYCFGRATDMADDFPLTFAPLALALSLPFGIGAFLGSASALAGIALFTLMVLTIHAWRMRRRLNSEATTLSDLNHAARQPATRTPRTFLQLRQALQSPLYQPAEESGFLDKIIETIAAGKTLWAGFVGPTAAGKSAAAEHLIRELQVRIPELRVLTGRCTEKSSAYQPFREALADVGVPQQILTSHSQAGGMNDLFDRLADRFIPFWEFFSGYRDRVEEDHDDDTSAPVELQAAVAKALAGAAQSSGLVLFLDDVQWIDDWSAQMLEHLREQFPPGEELPFLVLLLSREEHALKRYDLGEAICPLTTPERQRQKLILEKSLGIEPASAKRIVTAIGTLGEEAGGMFWLLRSIHELIERQALTVTPRGFALKREYNRGEQLPMPDSLRAELAAQFRASKEHRAVLECAALLGEKFRVSDLAECLEMDRLELLQILRTMEEEQQLVHDLPTDPECYSFSSAFMLQMIRDGLSLGPPGGARKRPTKIAQEWHARIARMLERRSSRHRQSICDLAWHYSAAGPGFEQQAVDLCLAAARLAAESSARHETVEWLQLAQQAAKRGRISLGQERWAEFKDLFSDAHSVPSADNAATVSWTS